MKVFRVLIGISAALVSSGARAHYEVYTNSVSRFEDSSEYALPRNRGPLIAEAAQAASAAYNDKALVGLTGSPFRKQVGFADREALVEDGWDVVSFGAAAPGRGTIPAGIVAYKEGKVTVAFHGSECIEDFTQANLLARKVDASELGVTGYVHEGFYTRYMQGRKALYAVLDDMLGRHGKTAQDVEMLITGHSLGGAVATAAAANLKAHVAQTSRLSLVTFSAPRVFDYTAAAEVESLVGQDRMIRVWRHGDPVAGVSLGTQLGLGFFTGYKHVGNSVKLDSDTEGLFPSLKNHDLGSILKGATSAVAESFHEDHVGVRSKIRNVVSRGVQTVTNACRSVFGALGRLCCPW